MRQETIRHFAKLTLVGVVLSAGLIHAAEFVDAAAGSDVNMAAWSDVTRIRSYSRTNPDKLLREVTRALDHAQATLEEYGAEGNLFAAVELRLFDVEDRKQEVEALRSTIRAWKEIENSDSAQVLLPVLENRLAELEMVPAEEE